MSDKSGGDRIREVGTRLSNLVILAIAAVIVLGMFGGLAFLVLVGQVGSEALLLFGGVILGYVFHATQVAIR